MVVSCVGLCVKNTMDKYLGKKYQLKTSDNFEDYLKFIEIGLINRKTALAVTPVAVLTKRKNGYYNYRLSTTFRTVEFDFKPGEEFIEERADGVKVKSKIVFEGDQMFQVQKEDNGRISNHVRYYTPNLLTVISTAEGWNGKCVRTYELIE